MQVAGEYSYQAYWAGHDTQAEPRGHVGSDGVTGQHRRGPAAEPQQLLVLIGSHDAQQPCQPHPPGCSWKLAKDPWGQRCP